MSNCQSCGYHVTDHKAEGVPGSIALRLTGGCRKHSQCQKFQPITLDPGIAGIVKALNDCGFVTSDSGDGSRNGLKADMECALDFPHVAGFFEAHAFALSLEVIRSECQQIKCICEVEDPAGEPWTVEIACSTDEDVIAWFAHRTKD